MLDHRFARIIPLALAAFAITTGTAETCAAQSAFDSTGTLVSGTQATRADAAMRQITDSGFSGVVLVAKNGEVILRKGYGLANRAVGTLMSPASVVQIGSNTKDFTIVAILQLMEREKLTLQDPITKYFHDVPADKRTITIDELLNHRAGFDQHLGPDFDVVTRDQEIARAMASTLVFPAGTDRKYSNVGYSLLAAIIEMVSGQSYDEYVRDHILVPLGLHETGLLLPHFDPRRVAHGYQGGKDMGTFLERPLAPDGPWWNLRGNGGMLSTVNDMYRFYRALMSDGPLLRPASRDMFFHPDEGGVLAGSDLTFFFFYSRNPGAGLDAFLVSNSTDYPAPRARQRLATGLGIMPPAGATTGPGMAIDTTPGPRRTIGGSARDAAGLDAPVAMPDTPAGRAARRFFAAQQGNNTALRAFLENDVIPRPDDHRTLDERVKGFTTMRENMGFLTPTRVVSSSAQQIVFEARSSHQGTMIFTIDVEAQAPFRITGLRVESQ